MSDSIKTKTSLIIVEQTNLKDTTYLDKVSIQYIIGKVVLILLKDFF